MINKNIKARAANTEIINAFKNVEVFKITPANNKGNPISPPPKIAVLTGTIIFLETPFFGLGFFSEYGINKPANVFELAWNFASFIICFVFQTAIMSYIAIKIISIETENMLKTGTNIAANPP